MFVILILLTCAPGYGQYSLIMENEPFTSDLLTVDEIRALYRHGRPLPKQPVGESFGVGASKGDIQLVSFNSTSHQDLEPETAQIEEQYPDYGSLIASVNGGTVYSSMTEEELNETLRDFKETINSDNQLNIATKTARLQVLSSANDAILKIQKATDLRQRFDSRAAKDRDEQGLKLQLEHVIEPAKPNIAGSTVEQLTDELTSLQSDLEIRKQELIDLEAQLQVNLERVSQIPRDRAEAKTNLEEIRDQITNRQVQADDMDNQLSLILLELKYRAAEAELAKLDSEEKRQKLGASVDPIHRDLKSRDVKRLEEEISRWEVALKNLRRSAVREEQLEASKDAELAVPSLQPLAKRNEVLVSERRELVENLSALRTERSDIQRQTETIVQRRTEIENKIEAAGLTATNGMLLVDLRRNLNSTGASHIRIRHLQTELRRVNLKKVGLNEERDELSDPMIVVSKLIDVDEQGSDLITKAVDLVKKKRDFVDQLVVEYQSYGREVSEVSQARKKLIDEINETISYIDENALWIRSAEPVGLADFKDVKTGIDQFFASDRWSEMALTTQQHAIGRPYESAMATLFLLGMLAVKRRVKRKLDPGSERDE